MDAISIWFNFAWAYLLSGLKAIFVKLMHFGDTINNDHAFVLMLLFVFAFILLRRCRRNTKSKRRSYRSNRIAEIKELPKILSESQKKVFIIDEDIDEELLEELIHANRDEIINEDQS